MYSVWFREDQIVVDNVTIQLRSLNVSFEDPTKTFLGWNIAFDLRFLYHHKIVPYNVWDGMIAEKLLYLGYPPQFHSLSLKAAADNYLGIDIDKTVRGQNYHPRINHTSGTICCW